MQRRSLPYVLIPVTLVAITLGMLFSASLQRQAATEADARTQAASQLLVGMLDQETGVRGFLLNGRDEFLDPFALGQRSAEQARATLVRSADGDATTLRLVAEQDQAATQWRDMADVQVRWKRASNRYRGSIDEALGRKALMDRMREINADLQVRLAIRRDRDLSRASERSTALIVLLATLIGGTLSLILRSASRSRRALYAQAKAYRASQREFTDVIQVVGSEPEAHMLLKRHLELRIAGATVTVLNRNNSDNRLEAVTSLDPLSTLTERLPNAEPASCLSVRLGRMHQDDRAATRLLTCDLCGASPGQTSCAPLLVSGAVIGSVLVEHHGPLDDTDERRLGESVVQAAPVLANLRNLALAERRAATDVLTGLSNRRAAQDTLSRMCAQASRNVQPLAAITVDLDRFKDVNDRFGHDMGDVVLAQAAALMKSGVRTSDFCARLGGEEFVILAPNTGIEGASILAENLRSALEREVVNGLDRPITASFGIAVLPDHAVDGDALMRLSDRALYAAKSRGRNRVEVVDELSGSRAVDGG